MIERRVADPMFRLPLFRIRAFTLGTLSTLLSAVARGGLKFMLIIWLQGIWLPEHGYNFTDTPLWAGIHMLPLTIGLLIAGPTSGLLSDRFGARPFATGGMIGARGQLRACCCCCRSTSPTRCSPLILLLNGISMGMFASPNRAAVMNSLPPGDRGAGGGMNQTFQNAAQVLSIGIFFSLMIIGLAAHPAPHALTAASRPTASPRPPPSASPTYRRSRSCLRPSSATTRSSTCSAPTCSARCSAHSQALLTGHVLPSADLRAVQQRPDERSCSRSSPAWSRPRRR